MAIEQDLKRIADALEILAHNSKFLSGLASRPEAVTAAVLKEDPKKPAVANADLLDSPKDVKPAADAAPSLGTLPKPEDREGIKAELDKRKVQYNPRLATKTLYELLVAETQPTPMSDGAKVDAAAGAASARPRPTPGGPVNGAPVTMVEVPPVTKKATADEVREAIKKFTFTYGNDKFLALLNGFGLKNVTEMEQAGRLDEFMDVLRKKGVEYDAAAAKK